MVTAVWLLERHEFSDELDVTVADRHVDVVKAWKGFC